MRVFVLGAGRCGTMTVAKALSHADNYTSGHETRSGAVHGRLTYPDYHAEVDCRLTWFLGSLDKAYGDAPLYVHLRRDLTANAESWAKRYGNPRSLMRAFPHTIVMRQRPYDEREMYRAARLLVRTANDNIHAFLRHKPNTLSIRIEDPHDRFAQLWERAGMTGDLSAALAEFSTHHNATGRRSP